MNTRSEVEYRLALAEGFLREARQDFTLERWRSCVDNAQLSLENAGEALLASVTVAPKTHEPAREIAALLRDGGIPEPWEERVQTLLPDFLALGTLDHFLTDCGDEASYTLPWDLFDRDAARDASDAAGRATEGVRGLLRPHPS